MIRISLLANDVEHLFMYLFVVYIFSPVQYLFVSFAHFLVGFFLTVKFKVFLIYSR